MTGAEKNGNGTAEFKGLLNDRISWDGCMDKKERLTTREGIKDWFIIQDFLVFVVLGLHIFEPSLKTKRQRRA